MTPAQTIPAWIDGRLHPVDKLEAHRRGLRHPAVSVFVMDGPRTLIQRRAMSKYHTPGLWANSCCTHPLWGEDPRDCAIRRMGQELGLAGLSPQHLGRVEYRAEVGPDMIEHEVVEIFRADLPPRAMPRPDPDEVMELRWLTLDQLEAEIAANPERFTPWLRIYMARHRDVIAG
ncbi:isopentenyl-diphosphate delta-isomerase [Albidovulum inexpectatum]|uniref:Isopentenyl-diphosphate Delta-isomerase n=1 Tax=Albidovulum inexpectatum TaxID=196587 RepID=A0A2S5JMM3_9RHOB|nr:isopentenyl-diphosphate Delta-isomerase [Albidovulum inexpectatum]PPB82682.1 isopentenyl-diphosphate delta-isomerase [Albidovulum inexpectatum]